MKPNSKEDKVEKINDNTFKVYVREPAKEDKANKAMIALLSDYFKLPKSKTSILKGMKAKHKVVEIVGKD